MGPSSRVIQDEHRYLFQTYTRAPVVFVRGSGCYLYDAEGRTYLDFAAGIAVNSLGHAHPRWIEALVRQAGTLVHTSNLYYTIPMVALAKKLAELSGMERAFFCNSGTEAAEAAIKTARKWGKAQRGAGCSRIITFEHAFHGRTFGALSATGQRKYCEPFEPLVPGFVQVPAAEYERLESYCDESVCAVLMEPIQGEGGVRPFKPEFIGRLRRLCDEKQMLLILDEVQTGIGRTGRWFAFEHAGILPDLCCLAKGLGGGVPIGACLARGEAAKALEAGEHGSTFAGNPLVCSAALSVLETIEECNLISAAAENGCYLKERLEAIAHKLPELVLEVRGIGLMLAMEFKTSIAKAVVSRALERALILNSTSGTVLRFVPPLIVDKPTLDAGLEVLGSILDEFAAAARRGDPAAAD